MRLASIAIQWAAVLACLSDLHCGRDATYADARSGLATPERYALDRVIERAGIDPSALVVHRDLYDLSWRGGPSHARSRGQPDRADRIDRQVRDVRNAVAVEGGHVVGLRLGGGRLDDLELAAPLEHLVVLDVHDEAIERIAGLDAMADLDHLDVSGNRLTTIAGLDSLHALRSLYLADNRITRIAGLDGLTSLEVLNLSGNAITQLANLSNAGALRSLSMARNPIAHIEGLDGARELVDLDLSFCKIEEIENLATVPRLKYLNLWHNQVRSLAGAEDGKGLVYLGLGENGYPLGDPESAPTRDSYCWTRLCCFI